MKLPRFRLRTLFVLIGLLSIPMGWAAYQLNWIRQRHEFLARPNWQARPDPVPPHSRPVSPWPLALFGEPPQDVMSVHGPDAELAQRLFPEAVVVPTEP
jgi:hypothetical protein